MTDTTIARQVRGICHHDCPDSCGWIVDVDTAGRAVALRGDPDHPFSRGELCPKVNRFIDRVYSPDRITTPLRRVGPKGSGEFEEVSWDDAMADIGARLNAIIAEHGGEAVLPYYDAGNQSLLAVDGISARLMHHIGATRLIRNICGPTAGAGMAMTNGTGLGMDPEDLAHSRLILLWGTNTRLTNRHLWPTLDTARTAGAQIVVIDPIRTITAERVVADGGQFIQPRPGTDVALMLAMMHEIISADLIDHDWVANHTNGFD
ncbi:MAG: molybdopterin-dependent oxidoreductase [Ilumatobacteraceae bacterium]